MKRMTIEISYEQSQNYLKRITPVTSTLQAVYQYDSIAAGKMHLFLPA